MTQTPVRLIPLVCIQCRSAVSAQPDEVAWVCEQCGQGLLLDAEQGGLTALDVFFSQAVPAGKRGRPFWVARGLVTITGRETYKGNETRAAQAFWESPRLFYIPAWEASLDEVIHLGSQLLRNPVAMQPGSRVPFLPVTTPPGDLRALAEFMIVSMEADRRDALKRIDFTLNLDPAQLWILP